MALADATLILVEAYVQLPVEIVLHAPVPADVLGDLPRRAAGVQRADVIVPFGAGVIVDLPHALERDDALEPRPLVGDGAQHRHVPDDVHGAGFDSAVIAIGLFVAVAA